MVPCLFVEKRGALTIELQWRVVDDLEMSRKMRDTEEVGRGRHLAPNNIAVNAHGYRKGEISRHVLPRATGGRGVITYEVVRGVSSSHMRGNSSR